jgi:hypothetical protein
MRVATSVLVTSTKICTSRLSAIHVELVEIYRRVSTWWWWFGICCCMAIMKFMGMLIRLVYTVKLQRRSILLVRDLSCHRTRVTPFEGQASRCTYAGSMQHQGYFRGFRRVYVASQPQNCLQPVYTKLLLTVPYEIHTSQHSPETCVCQPVCSATHHCATHRYKLPADWSSTDFLRTTAIYSYEATMQLTKAVASVDFAKLHGLGEKTFQSSAAGNKKSVWNAWWHI